MPIQSNVPLLNLCMCWNIISEGGFCISRICSLIIECKCSHNASHDLITSLQRSDKVGAGARTRSLSLGTIGCSAAPVGLCRWGAESNVMLSLYQLSKCLLPRPLHRKGAQGSFCYSQTQCVPTAPGLQCHV